uniref:Probable transposase n=1 Tax=Leptospirillum sp. Group II '5-way CG' TaxID=419541 RepID=B6AMW7_9BACT|nr:MAG: Probable transposase [Leptospirillum sp. Group II '5-way CG']
MSAQALGRATETDTGNDSCRHGWEHWFFGLPKTRDGNSSTDLFRRDRRSEQALVLARMEMVVQGVSARRVAHITEDWSVSVPPAGCSGDPCQKGRERGSGGRIDCDRRFGRRTTGAPGTTGFGISGAGDCVGWTWGSPMTTRS